MRPFFVLALILVTPLAPLALAQAKSEVKTDVHPKILEMLKETRVAYERQIQSQEDLVARKNSATRKPGRNPASIPPSDWQREVEKGDVRLNELSLRTQILSEWVRKRIETRDQLRTRWTHLETELQKRSSAGNDEVPAIAKMRLEYQMIREVEEDRM